MNVLNIIILSFKRKEVIDNETHFCDPEVLRKMLEGKVCLFYIRNTNPCDIIIFSFSSLFVSVISMFLLRSCPLFNLIYYTVTPLLVIN